MAMVDSGGALLAAYGNPDMVSFPRSSMKPFQALPLLESGGLEAFRLTDEELAIVCASHTGTDEHVRVLKSIHQKVATERPAMRCPLAYRQRNNLPITAARRRTGFVSPQLFRQTQRYACASEVTGAEPG